jgi:hypothetical protein
MFKDKTIELVEQAINEELKNAKGYGEKYNSVHEMYGVLKEEIEEMNSEVEEVKGNFAIFWNFIKKNNEEKQKEFLKLIETSTEKTALEALQVCAVCRKALDE